jgi:aminocarboxymuconate-semialdehyde decarboxylase
MNKIDMHTHILPRKIPKFAEKFGYGDFIHLEDCDCGANMVKPDGTVFRTIKPNCYDLSARQQNMDDTGVNVQVLSTVPIMFSYFAKPEDGLEISRFINDDIAESVEKGQKRFLGLGTLPMQDPELAILEMQRCKKDLGLSGIEIGTHINKWNLGHKDLFQFFVEAEKLEMSLFIHPWEMMGQDRMPEYWLPWLVGMPAETSLAICSLIFSGVMEKLPNLKLAFAHGGGSFPGTIGRIDHGFNTRPDLCAKDNVAAKKTSLFLAPTNSAFKFPTSSA